MSNKIKVAVLGATGSVGQKFIALLADHPWFELAALAASERSAGKPYAEAADWLQDTPLPAKVAAMTVQSCKPNLDCPLVFSGLDASVAGEIETAFAQAGCAVVSNARNHRMDADVPLLVPEINPGHLDLIGRQRYGRGVIVTNPNCSTIGMALALKPLVDRFGVSSVMAVTMQALSGGGFPGVPSMAIQDNVVPLIGGEEDKVENEPRKIFGALNSNGVMPHEMTISAQCNRVAVTDGHLESLSVKLAEPASPEDLIAAWREFRAEPQELGLPSAPQPAIVYFDEPAFPQPRLHRNLGGGMAIAVGRLKPCPILDYRFVALSHNTVRGAAGGAILCAELLIAKRLLDWLPGPL